MNDPRIDQAKGDVKTVAGKVTGDRALEGEGRVESAVAGIRKEADEALRKARDTAGGVGDRTRDVAGDVADRARDVAGDVADTASSVARGVTDKAKDILGR